MGTTRLFRARLASQSKRMNPEPLGMLHSFASAPIYGPLRTSA